MSDKRRTEGFRIPTRLICALAVLAILALSLAPTPAYATTQGELTSTKLEDGAPWNYDSAEEKKGRWDKDDLMSATNAGFDPFNFDIGAVFSDFLYGCVVGPAVDFTTTWADEFTGQIATGDLFSETLNGTYSDAYAIVLKVLTNVVAPVSNGFLGLSLVFSIMSFGREAGAGGRHGTDLLASYMWIAVKYALLSSVISHSAWILNSLFNAVNEVGAAMQSLGGLGQLSLSPYHDTFMEVLRGLTITQGGGIALIVLIAAAIVLCVCAVTAIYVQIVLVTRVFEACVLIGFSGFGFVMLGHQGTRESGLRYFKRFLAVCVQALVVALVVGLGSVFVGIAVSSFDGTGGSTLIASFMSCVGPIVGCLVMFTMVRMSREIANAIVGA